MSRAWTPYEGDRYLTWDEIDHWCHALADALPAWVELETIGTTRGGRGIPLLTVGDRAGPRAARPAIWIDGGTHAAELTGVMTAVRTLSAWAGRLRDGDPAAEETFRRTTAHVAPCISPDGYDAMRSGSPFIRSTLRPPLPGTSRAGFEPGDVDGDGEVRWMRWRHPAGAHVADPEVPGFMRPRSLDDREDEAFFFCSEGTFLEWDGERWEAAPLGFGVDLNRNFPSSWAPFSMFGMDGGSYPLSEPESRAVVDAFAARPTIAAALTLHTYTGCILTHPYREKTPLSDADIALLEALARDLVAGSGYRVYKVWPEFTYDKKKPIVGVWADALATTFGVPGYTIELWDPFGYAGVTLDKPAEFFAKPDPEKIRAVLAKFHEAHPDAWRPWEPFEHPQLGPVEIGGIDYMRTVRNPPEPLLRAECDVGLGAADRLLRAVPRVEARTSAEALGDGWHRVRLVLENTGFLPTSALARGADVAASPDVNATLSCDGPVLADGAALRRLDHLGGWGELASGSGRHSLYAGLPGRGHRTVAEWLVRGEGRVHIRWQAGRGGNGEVLLTIFTPAGTPTP